MSLKISRKKPVQIFLVAVTISMTGIYWLCDYYLNSVGRELMLNWVRTESALIQEGNLLTSSTKNQRFLLSSDYIRAVKLIKIDKDQVRERLHFGDEFNLEQKEMPEMNQEIVIQRAGFLHCRAFYKIPGRDEMYIVFDVESKVLNFVFFGGVTFLLLMLVALVATIRSVESQEHKKREDIFKQALNDFISKDCPSELVEKELPTLMTWWKDKKRQVEISQKIAIQNQSKIMLGEIASRVGHDIIGSVRNIEILARRTTGLNEQQKEFFSESINKIKVIAGDISKQTRKAIDEEHQACIEKESTDLSIVLERIVQQKQLQFEGQAKIHFVNRSPELEIFANLSPLEFERSISNLVNNAVEASSNNSEVVIELFSSRYEVEILIKDYGKGISTDDLQKIGIKGFTSGKENGTGIGVFYAKRFAEDNAGQLKIESNLGKGTTVRLLIPLNTSSVGPRSIELAKNQYLLVLDDQQLIRDTVRMKLNDIKNENLKYEIFSKTSELEQWLGTNTSDFKLFSDHFLENDIETGVEVVKRLGIANKSILFTSAFDNSAVIAAANMIGVSILSKEEFFEANIILK